MLGNESHCGACARRLTMHVLALTTAPLLQLYILGTRSLVIGNVVNIKELQRVVCSFMKKKHIISNSGKLKKLK